jgi:hypothetical protein
MEINILLALAFWIASTVFIIWATYNYTAHVIIKYYYILAKSQYADDVEAGVKAGTVGFLAVDTADYNSVKSSGPRRSGLKLVKPEEKKSDS